MIQFLHFERGRKVKTVEVVDRSYDLQFEDGEDLVLIAYDYEAKNLKKEIGNYGTFWKRNGINPAIVFDAWVDGKSASIRYRFQSILQRIKLYEPGKRVLVHADAEWVRKLLPDLEKKDPSALHGSIFKIDGIEFVLTFELPKCDKPRYRAWAERDVTRYKTLWTWEKLEYTSEPLPRKIQGVVVIDFETEDFTIPFEQGRLPQKLVLAVQYLEDGVKKRHLIIGEEEIENGLWTILASEKTITDVVGHNIQYDLNLTPMAFRRKFYGRVRDTMIRSRAKGEPFSGLKAISNYYTKRPGHYTHTTLSLQRLGSYTSHAETLIPGNDWTVPGYILEDIECTWQFWQAWKHMASKRPVIELMERATVVASCQTHYGTFIDREALSILDPEIEKIILELRESLKLKFNCEPGTLEFKQSLVAHGYKLKYTEKGELSAKASDLRELGLHDYADLIAYEKLRSSFVSTFVRMMRPDDTITHHQGIMSAETGRSTMSFYNHQQSPRKGPIRGLYKSRFKRGKFFSFDFAGAELRVASWISNCESMARWLLQDDAHKYIASKAFNCTIAEVTDDQRTAAKIVAFRTIYGGWPQTEPQKRVRECMTKLFPEFFMWLEMIQGQAVENTCITDPWGKTRNLRACWEQVAEWENATEAQTRRKQERSAGRQGVNSPIQGWSSHLAFWVMVRLQELFWEKNMQSLVLFGVHDSINSDIHPDEIEMATECYRQAMAELPVGDVPMSKICPMIGELQIAETWADTKKADKIRMSSGNAPGICHPLLQIGV